MTIIIIIIHKSYTEYKKESEKERDRERTINLCNNKKNTQLVHN